MEKNNDVIKENNSIKDENIKIEDNMYENNTKANQSNIKIKNRKFIEEIFKHKSNELIQIFKENLNENMKDFLNFLIQFLNDEKEKIKISNEEENLICYNLRQLKEIFSKSIEIIELIQFNKLYYNEEYKENGVIEILFNLYIYTSINNIKLILEEIFYIIKFKNNLSKIILNMIFQNIGKEYYWGENNNNNNFDNFLKYLNLLKLFICENDKNKFYNYLSYDLKKCEGIKGDINTLIKIKEKNTLNFQINFRIRNYHNNQSSKLISVILSNNKIELILNNTNINLYINDKLRNSMNFK